MFEILETLACLALKVSFHILLKFTQYNILMQIYIGYFCVYHDLMCIFNAYLFYKVKYVED